MRLPGYWINKAGIKRYTGAVTPQGALWAKSSYEIRPQFRYVMHR